MSISVVVPVYNEAETLPLLHQAVTEVMAGLKTNYELILVNDGSTDGSDKVLGQLANQDPLVKVIEFRTNYGQTAAMQAGIQAASQEVVVLLDADLQNDPRDIPMLLAKLDEGYDLVQGWRKDRQDSYLDRTLPSQIANWLVSRVTGFPVRDLGCSLKAIKTEIAQELHLYGEMHRFIPVLAHWRGARCVEVVTRHHPRRFGESKYGLSRTIRVLLDLLTVKYLIQYAVSPMKLFGSIGLICILAAGLSGTATAWMKFDAGIDMTGNPLLLLTAIAAIMGVQFLSLGLLAELGSRIYFSAGNQTHYTIRSTRNFESSTILFNQRRAA